MKFGFSQWLLVSACLVNVPVFAADAVKSFDWTQCKGQIEQFCKRAKAKGDRKIYECLSEHDEHHDNGIAGACDEAHSAYEKANGLSDPNEGKK